MQVNIYNAWFVYSCAVGLYLAGKCGNDKNELIASGFLTSISPALTCQERYCKALFNTFCLYVSLLTQSKPRHDQLLAYRREAYQQSKKCDRPVIPTHFVSFSILLLLSAAVLYAVVGVNLFFKLFFCHSSSIFRQAADSCIMHCTYNIHANVCTV